VVVGLSIYLHVKMCEQESNKFGHHMSFGVFFTVQIKTCHISISGLSGLLTSKMCTGIIFTKFEVSQLIHSRLKMFLLLIRYTNYFSRTVSERNHTSTISKRY